MVRLAVEEQKEYPTLPADTILHLKVESVELRTVSPPGRDPWDKFEFKFKILGVQMPGDGSPAERYDSLIGENIYGSTSTKITTSQENKLRLWSEAIMNRPLNLADEFDSDYFVGQQVRGVTSTYEKKNKNPATGLPFVAHQINSLLPLGGGVGGQAPVAQAPVGDPWGQPQPQQGWAPAPAAQQPDPWAAQPTAQPPAQDPWAAQQPIAQQAPPQQAQPQYQQPVAQPPAQQAPQQAWSAPGVQQQPAQQVQPQAPAPQAAPQQQYAEPDF